MIYFGQPSGGFFFCRDRFIASCHLPRIFSTSGLGPRFAPARDAGTRFADFFVAMLLLLGFLIRNFERQREPNWSVFKTRPEFVQGRDELDDQRFVGCALKGRPWFATDWACA
jgi:hypothetical protein